jgi:putative membrane protein
MTRTILAMMLSTAFALGACSNKTATDNNLATDDLNAMSLNTDMNAAATNATTGTVDAAFVTDGIKGDTAEIAIGQLAASKGSSQAVKDFGNMLVNDHGAHKQMLIDLANSAGIPVPTEPAEAGHANLLKLQTLSGTAFDKTFAQQLVESHEKGIAKNEQQAKSGDPQTAKLAQETLPTLRKHLGMAESLAK